MATFKEFTHTCDVDKSKPILNYAVIYDESPKRSLCFGSALIDEQTILCALYNQKLNKDYIKESLNGSDYSYADSLIYFFPTKEADKVKEILNELITKWYEGRPSGIPYSSDGNIYIALKHTPSGIWVLTYDETSSVAFGKAETMFDEYFELQETEDGAEVDFTKPFRIYNVEESSGDVFFEYLFENYQENQLFEFIKKEGVFDKKCNHEF